MGTGQPREATQPGPWALNPKGLPNLKSDAAKKRNDPFCRVLARGPSDMNAFQASMHPAATTRKGMRNGPSAHPLFLPPHAHAHSPR